MVQKIVKIFLDSSTIFHFRYLIHAKFKLVTYSADALYKFTYAAFVDLIAQPPVSGDQYSIKFHSHLYEKSIKYCYLIFQC